MNNTKHFRKNQEEMKLRFEIGKNNIARCFKLEIFGIETGSTISNILFILMFSFMKKLKSGGESELTKDFFFFLDQIFNGFSWKTFIF